ncbi:unnamed protein product [Gongylonema pulchrum]|uniref:PAZ domain-containing protein n=1 Tax=Gongylonema pulchrum TaxID=637853 RepID=A0A3P7NGZ0_9BILA|nr:unnamed protein product [Gongylonema pulchrum]
MFLVDGTRYKLEGQPLSECRTLVTGVDKGIRFVERSTGDIVPALVIDLKKAAFFDSVPLAEMVYSVLMNSGTKWRNLSTAPLDQNLFHEFVYKLNDIIRDLRLDHINYTKRSFLASGLSDKPTAEIRLKIGKNAVVPMVPYYQEQGVQIRPDWPAVRLVTEMATSYFPIEVLRVSPRQRVPVSKQTPSQMKDTIKGSVLAIDRTVQPTQEGSTSPPAAASTVPRGTWSLKALRTVLTVVPWSAPTKES